jgi:DNA helicase-2/ATP-dependent DNA helicase PcrA
MNPLLSTLNDKQQEAAHHIEGPLLVLAGAGSGKTRIVTHRIVHLIEMGVPPSEIVAVTFTNKAAEEMSSRVKSLTRQNVLITTFHSFSARILRESIHHLGFNPNFSIYDEQDSLSILKEVLEGMGLKEEKSLIKSIKSAISQAKNDLLMPDQLPRAEKTLVDAYRLYQEKLFAYNALDFDDLLFFTVKLLQNYPTVLKLYQERFSFLLIDEYQDTNEAQYLIAKMLAGEKKNIFVVGDPDQSIYSWRGANIQNILNFEKDFPGGRVVTLEQNYRSTNHILSAANKLIQNNDRPYEKNLWSALGDGEPITVKTFSSDREEASFVARTLLQYKKERNLPFSEIAIFYRTNAQSRSFEDALLKLAIPYTIVGGLSFYQRKEIKDILAFLRLIVSPTDFIAFSRTINIPKRGIGAKTLELLKTGSEEACLPILSFCRSLTWGYNSILSSKQTAALTSFVQLIDDLSTIETSIEDLIKELLVRSRYFDYLKEDKETYEDRKQNVEELLAKAAEWEEEGSEGGLTKFLEEISLQSSLDENRLDGETIKMMTLHNGKGLEFDLCFVVGMEEDLFPHANSRDDPQRLEEERRLCYVGMTRARKYLYLTASTYRYLFGTPRVMSPSRFLKEIGVIQKKEEPQKRESSTEKTSPSDEFIPGATVHHKTFGNGIIRKRQETSIGPTLDIYFFEDKSLKTLAMKYAKLTLAK